MHSSSNTQKPNIITRTAAHKPQSSTRTAAEWCEGIKDGQRKQWRRHVRRKGRPDEHVSEGLLTLAAVSQGGPESEEHLAPVSTARADVNFVRYPTNKEDKDTSPLHIFFGQRRITKKLGIRDLKSMRSV
jgi:hypothetical protein